MSTDPEPAPDAYKSIFDSTPAAAPPFEAAEEGPSTPSPPVPPTPPPIPAPAVQRGRGGSGGAMLLSVVLFAALGAAGYYAWTNPSPQARDAIDAAARQAQAASDQAGSLSQQFAALSARVAKLESAPPPAPPAAAAPDLGDLPKRVDDLAAKVDALASRPETAASGAAPAPAPDNGAAQQAVSDLSQRTAQAFDAQKQAFDAQKTALTELSSRLDQLNTRVAALEQGVGQARGTAAATVRLTRIEAALVALQAGQPLGDIPDAPPALARFAKQAPPTEAALRNEFPALADHAQAVSEPDLSGRSLWQRALTRLQSAVTVRQGSDVLVGDPASGILNDARVRVANGDLAGAIAVLRQLTGPAAAAMQHWVDQASAIVAARAALADLAAHA
jgi:hypothetical protein